MNTLCIYYDLNDPQHQYNTLINYLEQFKGYAQAGSRVWFVNSDKDCKRFVMILMNLECPKEIE